ncbi:unnamed protein product, partial [Notodromas monacha]
MREDILSSLVKPINTQRAKNIIIFVGDGMGNPITVASRIFKGQLRGQPGEEDMLEFERFPHTGISKTYCVDSQVADSACSATALFHGVKAPFKTLGVDRNVVKDDCDSLLKFRAKWPHSIAEAAQKAGMRTGFVTTTSVTHATPAALYAHSPNREWETDKDIPELQRHCKDIARQLVEDTPGKDFNVIMGGGLFASSHLKYETDAADERRRKKPDAQPSLEQMTIAAIETLSNGENGFFLM